MPKFIMVVEGERLTLDNDHIRLSEATKCERLTGMTVQEWWDAFVEGRAVALQFGYWLAKERAGEPVTFGDIDFDLGEFDFELPDLEPEGEPVSEEGPTGPLPEDAPA